MELRDALLAIYAAGPEAVVTWGEQLVAHHTAEMAQVLAKQGQLEQQVQLLTVRLTELEARLNKDSHNSHQPPSSDGPAKRGRTRSLRKQSGKKGGGQPGHPGVTRCLVDNPDVVIVYQPASCTDCGASLEAAPLRPGQRRQVIELPQPKCIVTEHQATCKTCPACQAVTLASFPPEVTQPVQYGPQLKAVAVYLQTHQLLPFERTVEVLHDLFGVTLSEGTLATALQQASAQAASVEQAIYTALRQAAVVHVDETGIRVAGHTEWVHVVSTAALTYYAHHPERGRKAIRAIGLLIDFAGRRVHDAWAAYLGLPGQYALCNAHLLRELIGLHEDTQQAWIQPFIRLLLKMQTTVATAQAAGQTALPAKQRAGFHAAYSRLLNVGLHANPPPAPTGKQGRPKRTPAGNLLNRLANHRAAILAFLADFRVPFDNNQAERDLRMLKVKLKVSGCFRSAAGADQFCRLRGYISTLRKQRASVLAGLTSLFTGQPYMPKLLA